MPATLPIALAALSAAVSFISTLLVRRWMRRLRFVDHPGGHKQHAGQVALGGGIAVLAGVLFPMLGVLVATWYFSHHPSDVLPDFLRTHLGGMASKSREGWTIIAGALVLHVLGLIDDARPLGAAPKFVVQILVAALLVIGFDLRVLSHLGTAISVTISIIWIVLITNAFNFLDNTDGLATGVAAIVAAIYAATAARTGQVFVPACCWLLVGSLLGFLPFNFQPASIFLGDSGSTVIGFLVAVFTILTTFYNPAHNQKPIGVLAPLVIMAVPLYDTASVFLLRWRSGRPIWTADRRHFSHRLVRSGMTARRAVLFIWLATFATALPALLLPQADWPAAACILAETLAVVGLVALMEISSVDVPPRA